MIRPRILLADDHPALLEALRDLMSDLGEVVGTVMDGQSLVQAAQRLKPDIIFTDISMPKMNGIDATRVLHAQVPQSRVIILSSHQAAAYVAMAFEAGACGYVLKKTALQAELAQALLHVLAGDRYVGLGVGGQWELGNGALTPAPIRSERPPMR